MKSQLLEDMVDSQSSLSTPLNRRRGPAATPAAPPPPVPPAPPVQGADARARAGVWRARAPQSSSLWRPRPPAQQAVPAEPQPDPLFADTTLRNPEPSLAEPDIGSFSSRTPDWAAPLERDTIPWTERWGRKALGWSVALAGVVAVAGAGVWMVRETQVESSLAVVAGHSPAPVQPAAPALPRPLPYEPPPLRMLPPEALVVAAPEPAPPARIVEPAVAPPAPRPAAKKPVARPTPQRRVAAAPVKRDKPADRKPAPPKGPSERVLARALADAQRSRQESLARPNAAEEASGPLSETLRLCRAAGYHASACMKRGCAATRFGLVCKG